MSNVQPGAILALARATFFDDGDIEECEHWDFEENQNGDRTCRKCGLSVDGSELPE